MYRLYKAYQIKCDNDVQIDQIIRSETSLGLAQEQLSQANEELEGIINDIAEIKTQNKEQTRVNKNLTKKIEGIILLFMR